MAPDKVESYWAHKLHEVAEDFPREGAPRLQRRLEEIAIAEQREDGAPSVRWVGTALKKHKLLGEAERSAYRRYTWPEAMERGALPWEASSALLELTHHLRHNLNDQPLTIRRAQWFWRVTLAAPRLPVTERDFLAHILDVADAMPDDSMRRRVEAQLRDGSPSVRALYEGHQTEPADTEEAQ